MTVLLALAAPLCLEQQPRQRPQLSRRCCAPPPRSPRLRVTHAAHALPLVAPPYAPRAQLLASVAAARSPAPPRPPASLASQGLLISLPAWLALALCFFLAAFAGLFGLVLLALLPVLREVASSARSVRTACDGVVTACDEVEKLAVLMQTDIRQVEEGISKPLATLTTLPKQVLQGVIDDPDTKLLRSVAGSVRVSTERNIRERIRRWTSSLEAIRTRLQADTAESAARRPDSAASQPSAQAGSRARAPRTGAASERAAVEAWAGAASAVAAAEKAASRLELALDTCQTEGACTDETALAEAAEAAVEAAAEGAEPPSNPS